MFKKWLAGVAAVAASIFGTAQYYANQAEQAVQKYRTENLAAFVATCPYRRANVPVGNAKTKGSYVYVWDRFAPYDAAVAAFAKNHGVTVEQAQECFAAPVKQ